MKTTLVYGPQTKLESLSPLVADAMSVDVVKRDGSVWGAGEYVLAVSLAGANVAQTLLQGTGGVLSGSLDLSAVSGSAEPVALTLSLALGGSVFAVGHGELFDAPESLESYSSSSSSPSSASSVSSPSSGSSASSSSQSPETSSGSSASSVVLSNSQSESQSNSVSSD